MINSTNIISTTKQTNSNNIVQLVSGMDAQIGILIDMFLSEQQIMKSSRYVYGWAIKRFFEWCKNRNSNGILSRADIIRYVDTLSESGYSAKTISIYTLTIRRFFSWLSNKGLHSDITIGVKSPRKQKDTFIKMHLDKDERRALLVYARNRNERDYAIINLMLRNGLRTIEVSRLDINDICHRKGVRILNVWRKGSIMKDDYVVLTDEAYAPIEKYLATRSNLLSASPLFVTNGDGHHDTRMSPRRIQQIVREGLTAIGLTSKEYSPHSLRHTTAVAILESGGNIFDVQRVLGHASSSTSQIYTKSIEEKLKLENPPENIIRDAF